MNTPRTIDTGIFSPDVYFFLYWFSKRMARCYGVALDL